jgi:hypothetical protein
MRDLPSHQHHQTKSELHETERHEAVLDADGFVVGGENVFAPKARLVMLVVTVIVVSMRGGGLAERRKLLNECFHVI